MKQILVGVFVFILLVQGVQGITDNMHLTVFPNSTRCVDILIPDDLGYSSPQKIDYILSSTATSGWSDLSRETIRTDSNNTVVFPVCFSGRMKQEGQCSGTFSIRVYAPELGQFRDFALSVDKNLPKILPIYCIPRIEKALDPSPVEIIIF